MERKWQPTPVFLLGNPTDRGAWGATIYRVTKSRTRLRDKTRKSEVLNICISVLPVKYKPVSLKEPVEVRVLEPLALRALNVNMERAQPPPLTPRLRVWVGSPECL